MLFDKKTKYITMRPHCLICGSQTHYTQVHQFLYMYVALTKLV
jgi:hypothetical protein